MKEKNTIEIGRVKIPLNGLLLEFRNALEDEIKQIENNGQSSILLTSGAFVEKKGDEYWYQFRVDYAATLPPDTPCKLVIGKNSYEVTVVSFDDQYVIVSSKSALPDILGNAQLENGAKVLLERLISCIERNAEKKNPAGERMLTPVGEKCFPTELKKTRHICI